MIQLYIPSNTDFESNGNYTLHPTVCDLSIEKNGTWEIELDYPIDEERIFCEVVEGAVIAAPTPYSEKQLFRIYHKDKTDDGVIAHARPIFFDSAHDVYIIDKRPTSKTGQQALDILMEGTKYTAESDITSVKTSYIQCKNLIEALFSDDENSFLMRWGGEPIFDNYKVIINERCGGDYGLHVTFGKNLMGIEEDVNMDEVATRIYPKAYNGYTLENNGYVDSPNITKYPIVYKRSIEYSDIKLEEDCREDETGYNTLAELRQALIERCNKEFKNGIDKPTIKYNVDMVDLSTTDEYKEYKELESVGLGDTVYCKNERLGIETTARVIKITYDCITKSVNQIELGDTKTDYFDKLNTVMQSSLNAFDSVGNVKGANIAGVIDLMQTSLKASREVAKKQKERAILFEDLDQNSPTFGAMALGTTGFCIASKRTVDGKDWAWKTFGTGKGFLADLIIGGMLISQNYDTTRKQGILFDLNSGLLKAFNFELDIEHAAPGQKIISCKDGNKHFTLYPSSMEFYNDSTEEYLRILGNQVCGGKGKNQTFSLDGTNGYSGQFNGKKGATGTFSSREGKQINVVDGTIESIED